VNRGDVYDVEFPHGRHPAVVVTRDTAIPLLTTVTVVGITSRIRGLRTEVPLGLEHGLARDCAANCDHLFTLEKRALGSFRGMLGYPERRRLDDALRIALGLD
jgi:mRNA interferase MazF